MQYYRCKCGNSTSYGSMPPASCTRCGKCKSNLSISPDFHSEPLMHDFVTKYDGNTGEPYEYCRRCHISKTDPQEERKEP